MSYANCGSVLNERCWSSYLGQPTSVDGGFGYLYFESRVCVARQTGWKRPGHRRRMLGNMRFSPSAHPIDPSKPRPQETPLGQVLLEQRVLSSIRGWHCCWSSCPRSLGSLALSKRTCTKLQISLRECSFEAQHTTILHATHHLGTDRFAMPVPLEKETALPDARKDHERQVHRRRQPCGVQKKISSVSIPIYALYRELLHARKPLPLAIATTLELNCKDEKMKR